MTVKIWNNRKIIRIFGLKLSIKLRPAFWKIILYRLNRKFHKTQTVCYTCLCGDYDELKSPYYISFDWDYVCFTDNAKLLKKKFCGIWEIRPLVYQTKDNGISNRYHKFFPYKILPEYETSIYIDSNINILTSKLERTVKEKAQDFLLPRHFCNECIYEELDKIVQDGKDTAEHMTVLRDKYQAEQMPRHLGFAENNIIYRRRDAVWLHALMEEWWQMLLTYSKRDQASLVYILWKNGYAINDYTFDNCRIDTQNFWITDHKRSKK